MTDQLRILLVGRHPILLEAIASRLSRGGYAVGGSVTSITAALRVLDEQSMQVVIFDLAIGDFGKLSFFSETSRAYPDTAIIVVSETADEAQVDAMLNEGVAAFVRRDAHPEDLVTAVRQAIDRSVFLKPTAAKGLNAEASVDGPASALTPRELEILRLLPEGGSGAAIASQLLVSEQTVKFHLSNIYRKLGVPGRTEATRYAATHELERDAEASR